MGNIKTIGLQMADRLREIWRRPDGRFPWRALAIGWLAKALPQLRRRRVRQRMQSALAALPAAAAALEQASTELERDFLATGAALEKLNQRGQQFMKGSGHLVLIAIGQSDGKEYIANGSKVVEEPLIFLERCLVESERLQSQLREDHQGIEQLLQAEANLRRTMAPLQTIQTLFKIECAPLGAEAQTMFTALTQEIERMHNQVCELFDTKFTELRQVEQILDAVGVKLEHQTTSLRNFVTKEKTEIQDSLRQLSAELVANQQREVRIQNLSREVTREIQAIIVGLQFQDIINQKLQHTRAAVTQLLERFGEDEEALHFLAQSSRLEAGQLQAVRQDLAHAEQTVQTGIANLLEHLSEADTNCLSLKEFDRVTASSDGMIQVLLGMIESVRSRVKEMYQRTAELQQPLQPIHNMAAGLTLVVRQLSYRIHLIGLNAQVQAAHFRHGAGLEVLSARTSEISLETNRISETVATHLDQIAAGLNQNVEAFNQLNLQARTQQEWLAHQGHEAETGLHRLRDEALTTLQEVGELLEQIKEQAGEALGSVRYRKTADATLAALQSQLQTLGETAVEQLGPRYDPARNVLGNLHRNYTMDSERQIYQQVVQGMDQNPGPPALASLDPAGVELFAPEAPTSMIAPEVAPEPIPVGPQFPLTPALTAGSPPPDGRKLAPLSPLPPAPGRDLGDNVELF